MDKIGFLFDIKSSRTNFLLDVLKDEYEIIIVHSLGEAITLFDKSFKELAAFIIDRPSDKRHIDDLLNEIAKRNTFMFALPVLLLTGQESSYKDEKYLSDLAVAMINEGDGKQTVIRRIKNSIKFTNSASFDEFSKMLKVLPSLVYLKDIDGRYAFCSQNWHHLENPKESIRGLTDFDVRKNKKNAEIARQSDLKLIESGVGTSYIIAEDADKGDGSVEYFQIIKEPLKDDKGKVNGIIAIINNVTDQELLRRELRQKSITDQLTGLYNRAYFEELAETYKSDESMYPFTIITADCDGLKKINDRFGHAAGDKYICFARDAIKESLPENSYLFRMGGDEFIAVIPRMRAYDAAKVVKEIVKNAEKYKTAQYRLKLSAGSYTILKKGMTVEGATALSDKAMYKMKREHKKGKKEI